MNPLLSVLVQLGIIDAATADRLNAQLDPDQARAYAEQQLTTTFTGGLQGQYERVLQFVARQPQATQAQWDGFWQQENAALWASVGPTMTQLASDGAIVATLASGNPDNWRTVNQKVVDWTRTYYATSNEYGSIPNLNQTARQEVGDAVVAWNRGELASRLGLPSLALELQPTFGEQRANVIAVTEYTRIATQTKIVEAEADEFIEYYRWMTAADEIVCPQCGPLHGTVVSKSKSGGFVQPGGGAIGFPPRHPNCRCDLAFETSATKDVPLRDLFKYQPPKSKATTPATPQPQPAWKPSMSRADAEMWAADSAIKEDVYHVTPGVANERSIKANGFNFDTIKFGRMWGNGVYVGTSEDTAEIYKRWTGQSARKLTIKANVKNPAIHIDSGKYSDNDNVADVLSDVLKMDRKAAYKLYIDSNRDIAKLLSDRGHDALILRGLSVAGGGDQMVIFDPKNVAVIDD